MNVLVACEFSGIVRDAFRAKGHNAWSCDLEPSEREGPHFQMDVREVLKKEKWDLMIAHPPCTYLCVAGNRWFVRNPWREVLQKRALAFARELWESDICKIAIENPVGVLSREIGPWKQKICPTMFGHPETKKTCLWLKGLRCLRETNRLGPSQIDKQCDWYQVDSWKLPAKERKRMRNRTFQGIADAMAAQWG